MKYGIATRQCLSPNLIQLLVLFPIMQKQAKFAESIVDMTQWNADYSYLLTSNAFLHVCS